jgi:hypothetical protein
MRPAGIGQVDQAILKGHIAGGVVARRLSFAVAFEEIGF